MHPSVLEWVPAVLNAEVAGARVLEVGAYDVNGSVRPALEALGPACYVGVDQSPGPRVDRVVACEDLVDTFGAASFDIVLSCEMLEHAEDWRTCLEQMATVSAGLLVITTRGPGFPYHPFPDDFWRFTVDDMAEIMATLGCTAEVVDDPQYSGVFAIGRRVGPIGDLSDIEVACV